LYTTCTQIAEEGARLLLGCPSTVQSNGFAGVPAIFLSTYFSAGYTTTGTDPYGNYRLGQDTGQLSVTVDKVRGPHDLKFGFDGRLHQINYIQTNAPVGIFSFNEHGSSACPNEIENCGGDAMASFMMGQMTQEDNGTYYEIQFRPATTNRRGSGMSESRKFSIARDNDPR